MLKLLIVDDEKKVCQLIEYLLDWKSYGIEIAGTANDGRTAYQKIIELEPDIVITDIRMPIYDGIELIKKSKEQSLDISFIIISGYSQFEYAQSAIQYGVVNYLLKPIKKKELQISIDKILKKIETKTTFENENKILKNHLAISEKNNRINLIRDLIVGNSEKGPVTFDGTKMEDINKEYSCNFQEGYFFVVVLCPFLPIENNDKEMWNLLQTKISSITEDHLQKNIIEKVSLIREKEIIYFINSTTDSFSFIKKDLLGMTFDFTSLTEIFEEVRVAIGVSTIVSDIKEVKQLYFQANTALLNRFTSSEAILCSGGGTSGSTDRSFIDTQFRNQILSDFERLDIDAIINRINDIFDFIKSEKLSGTDIQQCYIELMECIEFSVNTYLPSQPFPDLNFFRKKFQSIYNLKDIQHWLNTFLRKTFIIYFNNKKQTQSRPIRLAKKYIYDFYNTNISLTSISDELGFNPSYFSSLFKKETGENFMDYVIGVRMDYAKQYLSQTDFDIYEIAEKVGYTDTKYFNKIFKRIVHLTPLEYRKIYG